MFSRILSAVPALLLAACAGGSYRPVGDDVVKIGAPYVVRGQAYVPAADPTYDMLGLASWYGHESGKRTANGERFRAKWVTAAHATLPLPSYVEVTALDTGRRIVVRVNDRGPFTGKGRILDLSRGAAEALGARGAGVVPVRVRIVSPDERDRARLRKGKAARELPPVDAATRANLRAQLRAAGW
ncbi:septal ring lytic transglycosylase RlpA family protein [Sphingomonas sp. VNH70]